MPPFQRQDSPAQVRQTTNVLEAPMPHIVWAPEYTPSRASESCPCPATSAMSSISIRSGLPLYPINVYQAWTPFTTYPTTPRQHKGRYDSRNAEVACAPRRSSQSKQGVPSTATLSTSLRITYCPFVPPHVLPHDLSPWIVLRHAIILEA